MPVSNPLHHEAQAPSSSAAITIADTPKARPKKDRFDRFAWRAAVFADPETAANAKCLAFGIAEFVNGETGEACPSTITLAKVCGCSETWVRKVIPILRSTGWIEVQYGSQGRGEKHCNVYRINREKRTRGAVLTSRGKGTVKPHFSPLKPHPVCEEPLNHKQEADAKASAISIDRFPTELRERKPVTDAAPSPVKTIEVDAALCDPTKRETPLGARLDQGKIGESQTTSACPSGSSFLARPRRAVAKSADGAAGEQRNGHAAHRPESQPRQCEVDAMTLDTNDEHFETFFQLLLSNYPRTDAADEARRALRDCLTKSSNPGQTRCLLLDGAERHERETRARGSSGFLRLDDFVRSESWSAEKLPSNIAAAA